MLTPVIPPCYLTINQSDVNGQQRCFQTCLLHEDPLSWVPRVTGRLPTHKLSKQVVEEVEEAGRAEKGGWPEVGIGPVKWRQLPGRLLRASNLQIHLSPQVLGQTSLV